MRRERKPRTKQNKQQHDPQEWVHPIVVRKAGKRMTAGLCIGCGHTPCKCKSKD